MLNVTAMALTAAGSFRARARKTHCRARRSTTSRAVRPLGSLPCVVRPHGSLPCAVRPLSCAVRHTPLGPCALARCVHLAQVHTRVRHVTCEPIRARHTVAPYWLTRVRRARHSRTHAPFAQPHVSHAHDCHFMRRITYHLVLATLVLHHARAVKNTKAALKRLAAMRACEVRHQSATLRLIAHATRASVCECECELGCSAPFASPLVSASMKQ
ncbi:hypothetical protein Hanom_Chr00s010527g01746091 [Helianthus anomalus]